MTIYFISDGESVKIGYTKDKTPEKRLSQLQTGNANRLNLIGFVPGDTLAEKAIHSDLAKYRKQGEWFSLCPPVSDYIFNKLQKRKDKPIGRSKKKPMGFGQVDPSKVLSKKQRNDILSAKPSLLSFVDTEDGTMVVPSSVLKEAIKNKTTLDYISIDMPESNHEWDSTGVAHWLSVIHNWDEWCTLPLERQQHIIAVIVEDIYPQIRPHITDILQDPTCKKDSALIPVIQLERVDKNKELCYTSITVYPCEKYLTTHNQHLARYIAQFGTFPLAINMGKDVNGHDLLAFTPITDDDMTSLGWNR